MKIMNCDIIQDLIPSYVDGICSDASKECVEEHVRECNRCKKQVMIYQDAEISDSNIEQIQIDGFKKFHNKMKLMNLFSMVLVILLIGLGTYTFCTSYRILSTFSYYMLFPICMIGLYLFTTNKKHMQRLEKKDSIVAVLSLINIVFTIGFMFYVINCIISGKPVFSVKSAQLGPFINKVWGIQFLLFVIGFVYLLLRMIRNNINNKSMICLQMMGMFLLLAYVTVLKELISFEEIYGRFTQITVIIVTTGLIGSLLFAVIGQKGKKAIK